MNGPTFWVLQRLLVLRQVGVEVGDVSIPLQVERRGVHFVPGFRHDHGGRTEGDRSSVGSGRWSVWILREVRTELGLLRWSNTIQHAE